MNMFCITSSLQKLVQIDEYNYVNGLLTLHSHETTNKDPYTGSADGFEEPPPRCRHKSLFPIIELFLSWECNSRPQDYIRIRREFSSPDSKFHFLCPFFKLYMRNHFAFRIRQGCLNKVQQPVIFLFDLFCKAVIFRLCLIQHRCEHLFKCRHPSAERKIDNQCNRYQVPIFRYQVPILSIPFPQHLSIFHIFCF